MNSKIYFTGMVHSKNGGAETHRKLTDILRNHGEVFTGQFGNYSSRSTKEDKSFTKESRYTHPLYNTRNPNQPSKPNILVAEVTSKSLSVSYDIAMAMQRDIPILFLYQKSKNHRQSEEKKQLTEVSSGHTIVTYGTISEAEEQINRYFKR